MDEIRVVLVEDHDLTRMGLRTALQQYDGIKVIGEANNGMDGLKLLESSKSDVAVVDIGLPHIDGIELTRRFKQSQAGLDGNASPTKIVMLTMQSEEDAVLAAFAAGADSYCMKSLNTDSIIQALRTTYQGNNWIDPAIASIVLHHNQQLQSSQATNGAQDSQTVAIAADLESIQMVEAYPLTERELEVLELIVAGHSNEKIANQLYITVGTVKTHVRNILNKLCVDDRTQAAVRALRSGLVV